MQAALSGFSTIGVIVAVGWLLAHLQVLGDLQRALLSRLAFLVASPALLFSLVSTADLQHLFSTSLLVSVIAIATAGGLYLLIARLFFADRRHGPVIGWLASSYTNAGNLGLPIAAAIMGDMTWAAPIMLIQVGLLQPIALGILDTRAARVRGATVSWLSHATLPLRNPITIATLLGVAVNLSGTSLPATLMQPIQMVGAIAVPAMLIAFGVSLRLDPLPGRGPHARELVLIQLIKVILHPLTAFLVGRYGFQLAGPDLLAVTVLAALPTAQNVYVMAARYDERVLLARDAIFWSTMLAVPVIVTISTVLR